jgi:hypothetical protein
VTAISSETVRRILASHKLKPWRHHMWLYPQKPRDEAFYACSSALIELYTRPLTAAEVVLSIDEKSSLQPRPRPHPIKPAQPDTVPHRVEHAYRRAGALHLLPPLIPAQAWCTGHVTRRSAKQN